MEARLAAALQRTADVERALADPATVRDPKKIQALGREHARLQKLRATAERLGRAQDDIEQAREVARSNDPDLLSEQKQSLILSRALILSRIKAARDARYRAQLQIALDELESQLREFD